MLIKITLEDHRTIALHKRFAYIIDLKKFAFLAPPPAILTPKVITDDVEFFADIGVALQIAIDREKRSPLAER